jgi:Putative peptidoglycan binding domain
MRARVIAPLVAAVLGISGGIVTALVGPGDDGDARTSAINDPLHLGIPLVSQDCTGEALLVVGYGNNVAPLTSAVANNDTLGLRYLRSDESCETILGPEREETPAYVVYFGPYETLAEPCEKRMTPEHRGDFVTLLRSGNDTLVKCPCALPTSLAPELTPNMVADAEETVWIRALQAMLNDYDPARFPHSAISGRYDEATVARVTQVQEEVAGVPTTPGVVDAATWQVLTDRICRIYDY